MIGGINMRQEKGLQNIIIVVLSVAVLAMSVGFAVYAQQLNVTGTATFSKASWDVHFDTTSFNETSTIKASTKSVGNTAITYSVTLPSPGAEYSFTVDAKNFGTIDAALEAITLSGLTTAQQKYISYTVNYNGVDYDETTDGLAEDLAVNDSHTLVVTVNYLLPDDAEDLPSTDQEVNLTVALDYITVD
jgi:hypothetical protein